MQHLLFTFVTVNVVNDEREITDTSKPRKTHSGPIGLFTRNPKVYTVEYFGGEKQAELRPDTFNTDKIAEFEYRVVIGR